jgi:hypothetical protein
LIAGLILVMTLQYTLGALRTSGAWRTASRAPRAAMNDPYSRLDRILAQPPLSPQSVGARNPFAFGAARPTAPTVGRSTTPRVPAVAPVARPQLTAIIWDADPRALIRYDGRDYTVRENSLFGDFRVSSITQSNVTLERNGTAIVLNLRPRGE